jgi:hypothetical protein
MKYTTVTAMAMNAISILSDMGVAIKDDGGSVAWMGLNFPKEEFREFWRKDEGARVCGLMGVRSA